MRSRIRDLGGGWDFALLAYRLAFYSSEMYGVTKAKLGPPRRSRGVEYRIAC